MSQPKAKMQDRGPPRCSPAATHVTIPISDFPEAASDPLPFEVDEGECIITKDQAAVETPPPTDKTELGETKGEGT